MNKSNSTEVFVGAPREVPEWIKNHELFKKPVKIDKIFPSLGLINFKDKVNIEKPIVDMRKDGVFVINLLQKMTQILNATKEELDTKLEIIQFSSSAEERANLREKMQEAKNIKKMLTELALQTDPNSNDVVRNAISMKDGRITLRLFKSIKLDDKNEKEKPIFVENSSLFKAFAKIEEACVQFGVSFPKLDKTDEFKIFSKENTANKEYSIVFSSTGKEGAWDILTMSMRGIKSCQSWTNSYYKCLIGSITSKFVGVIYLTSGVDYENYGSKMLKRCVVRYSIDADENKPCVIVDKMYPEYDELVAKEFIKSLQSKIDAKLQEKVASKKYSSGTPNNIKVFYITDLEKKTKHIYMPDDTLSKYWKETEYSYQDSPFKMRRDYLIHTLTNKQEEFSREIEAFKYNFALYFSRQFDAMNETSTINRKLIDPECLQIIRNIRLSVPSTKNFSDGITNYLLKHFKQPPMSSYKDAKAYMRLYIRSLVASKKGIKALSKNEIFNFLKLSSSRDFSFDKFFDLLFTMMTHFCGLELKKMIS